MSELTAKDVVRKLQINASTLEKWRAEGLPHRREKGKCLYDATEVAAWCLANGKAQRKSEPAQYPILRKRNEVAVYFGVGTRSVSSWLEDPSFPGRSGGRGSSAHGYFPVKAIADWLQANGKKAKCKIPEELQRTPDVVVTPTSRDRLVEVKTEQAALELRKMQGKMIDAEVVAAFFRRTNSYAVTILRGLPARLLAAIPSHVDEKTRTAIYETAMQIANETRSMLAELIEGDKDEQPGKFRESNNSTDTA